MAGRPRLHTTQADKQFAYRQRQREQRDTEAEQLAAWPAVRAAATATGVLTGDESEFEAGRKIAHALDTAPDGAPVFIPLL